MFPRQSVFLDPLELTTADFDHRNRYVEALENRLSKVEDLLKKVPHYPLSVLSYHAHS